MLRLGFNAWEMKHANVVISSAVRIHTDIYTYTRSSLSFIYTLSPFNPPQTLFLLLSLYISSKT